jgi:hypothetical protein
MLQRVIGVDKAAQKCKFSALQTLVGKQLLQGVIRRTNLKVLKVVRKPSADHKSELQARNKAVIFPVWHVRLMIADVEEEMAREATNLDRFRAIVELNARSTIEQGDPQRAVLSRRSRAEGHQGAGAPARRYHLGSADPSRSRRQDRQAVEECLHHDAVRHAQLEPHLVRSQGRYRAEGFCRYGGRSVPARLRRAGPTREKWAL